MENRLEILRAAVDKLIYENRPAESRYFISHLYGVSRFCALLAIRRGLNAELAAACGMLHDIYQVTAGVMKKHAVKGAAQAKIVLEGTKAYTDGEISVITHAISRHGEKRSVHGPYDELLKDADVMDHCFGDPDYPVSEKEMVRYNNLLTELGCR